jgi:hypothetical protein
MERPQSQPQRRRVPGWMVLAAAVLIIGLACLVIVLGPRR